MLDEEGVSSIQVLQVVLQVVLSRPAEEQSIIITMIVLNIFIIYPLAPSDTRQWKLCSNPGQC